MSSNKRSGIPDPDQRFFQARLKHIWANEHINKLHAAWNAFLETDFCRFVMEQDADGSGERLRAVSTDPLPGQLVLILGDAVHNLRCALDYTINEILGRKDTRLTFPMHEEREELVASFRTDSERVGQRVKRKGGNAPIEMAAPGIGRIIVEQIRPYKASDSLLWHLGRLDGRDKHRLLIPVLVPQTITCFNVVDKHNNRIGEASGTIGPGGYVDVAFFGDGGVKIESYGKPTAEIFFNETGVIEGQPVFPTLVQMSHAVAETINSIDIFLTDTGWIAPTSG